MQAEVQFDKELFRFLAMAIDIWPAFQSGIKHLHDVSQPPEDSYIPQRSYSNMTQQQFTKTITTDLFEFIMTHDVRENDLYDYLADILDLLMMDEELSGGSSNPASIEFMARYAYQVIEELQTGKNTKVVSFEQDVYQNVKQFRGEIVKQQQGSDRSSDEQEEQGSGSEDGSYSSQEEEVNKVVEKSQQEKQKQKQLQDDGWIIVKKK